MKSKMSFILIAILFLLAATAGAEEATHQDVRKKALKAYSDGNWNEAFELYRGLSLEIKNDPRMVGTDFIQAWQCLRQLNRINELDAFREKVIQHHADNWRLLLDTARSFSQNNHWGYIVAGEFHRGHHRGGGKYVNAIARDRVRTLQLMQQAMGPLEKDPSRSEAAQFYLQFAGFVHQSREAGQAWRLQVLTDLTQLPDYAPGYGHEYDSLRGAPVDTRGQPVFYGLPEHYERAASDGERWRWLLAKAAQLNPSLKNRVDYTRASFLHQQFGVQTLVNYGALYGRGRPGKLDDDQKDQSSVYDVHTLTDQETIANLAVGVRRFNLLRGHNFILIYQALLEDRKNGYAGHAARALAQIYENRRQYDRAIEYWKMYQTVDRSSAREHIDQITKSWGVFEPVGVQPSGTVPSVEFRFRNARRVEFVAYHIRVNRLLEDVRDYILSEPARLDGQKLNLNDIGWRIVHENQTRYIGKQAASWQLALDPDRRHWDRYVTVKFPNALKAAGAYMVEARVPEGNSARIVIWVADTVIVNKPLQKQMLYYVADAVTGRPLSGADIDFFGYRTRRIEGTKRYRVLHKHLKRQTGADGLVIINPAEMSHQMTWVATASTPEGRLAFLGFSNVWYPDYHDREYSQTKTLIITDRPVYRPDQTVKFKAWVRHAKYDKDDTSSFAGRHFTVRIHNPKNEQIYSKTLTADAFGGVEGEFTLAADAALGLYRISHGGSSVYGGQTFRVEEYKKPEFEVTIETPSEPVVLGEKITAKIKAAYYFGSPVTEAVVKYKVLRSKHDSRWYPAFYWDWFYGPGYWWYAYDYPWYPDWENWGCLRPIWSWWPHWPRQQPEIVADGEVNIGRDGTVNITIDTALAKMIHGDSDHRYVIKAEVRDQSRRTIVGEGEVLVARRPFKVYAWLDKGYYRMGEPIKASFRAQTLDQKPVHGPGRLRLMRITYKNNKPRETKVAEWPLNTDAEGNAALQIQASTAGQYRLSYRVTDAKNHAIEGGYIFTVRGSGDDGSGYRFAKIELITDKAEYAPGDTVRLQINTERKGATVMFFVRPANGVYLPPKIIRMGGKSILEEIKISKKDMPNIFVEAVTVYDGKVHSEIREIVVPPEKRVLNVKVTPSATEFRPGQKARLKVQLIDYYGEPFQGSAVISVYDRAVEYISGGSNVPEIRSFFWKWRRHHQLSQQTSLSRWFTNLLKKN